LLQRKQLISLFATDILAKQKQLADTSPQLKTRLTFSKRDDWRIA
jgi:hypothetical protein